MIVPAPAAPAAPAAAAAAAASGLRPPFYPAGTLPSGLKVTGSEIVGSLSTPGPPFGPRGRPLPQSGPGPGPGPGQELGFGPGPGGRPLFRSI